MDTKQPKKVDGRKNNAIHLAKVRPRGRAKGVLNKETTVKLELTKQGVTDALTTGLSPMQVMLNAMRNPDAVDPRSLAAAEAVAPYVHPKLSAVAYKDMNEKAEDVDLSDATDEELELMRKFFDRQTRKGKAKALPGPVIDMEGETDE